MTGDGSTTSLTAIKQIINDGMLEKYEFSQPDLVRDELVEFVEANQDKLRELSLRMVLKLADLRKSFPTNWQAMAKTTCMRRS